MRDKEKTILFTSLNTICYGYCERNDFYLTLKSCYVWFECVFNSNSLKQLNLPLVTPRPLMEICFYQRTEAFDLLCDIC